MKRKFEELRENLDEFVEQNDYPVLIVGCLPDELAYVVKFLQALDEKHPSDLFLIFPQPFDAPGPYLDRLVESLHAQLEAAGPARAERGDEPFPPLPSQAADPKIQPGIRLLALVDYFRTLLPNEKDHRAVAGFLPLVCSDFDAYARLMGAVFPAREMPPSMAALRIVAYDDRSTKRIALDVRDRRITRVLMFEVDFSTPALTNALSVGAADTALPVPERMACLLQLAALDFSYKRHDDAIEKYGLLYTYYEGAGLRAMQALCLLGAGDTLRAAGQPARAKEMLQRGIALAIEHKALAMLLNGLLSIVEVCFELGEFADAESYADSGTKAAAAALNPFAYADLFERRGDAQLAQRHADDAVASYGRAREISKMYDHAARSESVLPKLASLYKQRGQLEEQRAVEREFVKVLRRAPSSGARA
jgi:tetratricopeptide (TPR) repeat protein